MPSWKFKHEQVFYSFWILFLNTNLNFQFFCLVWSVKDEWITWNWFFTCLRCMKKSSSALGPIQVIFGYFTNSIAFLQSSKIYCYFVQFVLCYSKVSSKSFWVILLVAQQIFATILKCCFLSSKNYATLHIFAMLLKNK